MKRKERVLFFVNVAFRCLVSVFDLFGILAIGYLATSMAMFVSAGSDPTRVIKLGSWMVPAANIHTLPWLVGSIMAAFTIKALASVYLTKKNADLIARVEARSAKVIAAELLGNSLEEVKRYSREEITFAIQSGSPSAFNGLLNAFATVMSEGFLFVLLAVSFIAVNPLATLGMLAYFALIGFCIQVVVGGKTQKASLVLNESAIKAHNAINDLVNALKELAVSGSRAYYVDRIYAARQTAADQVATQVFLAGMPRYIVETALLFGVFAFGLIQLLTGDLVSSATTLGVFLTGGFRIMASMLPLQSALVGIKGSIPGARIALDVLSRNSRQELARETSADQVFSEEPEILFSNVDFSYTGTERLAVRGLTMGISFGSQVALIGPSGAGKSTVADLMCGLVKPVSGKVSIGGLTPQDWITKRPGSIAYVPQFPGRLSGTMLENIAVGVNPEEVDNQRLSEAIKRAHLESVIADLPDGVNSDLGKHSDSLSGGQLQRVGLARALYLQPKILVMDEATSGLDAHSEEQIRLALESIRGSVTVVLIAHRLNTVQGADKVFLLNGGELQAEGVFSELVRDNAMVAEAAELMRLDK